MPLGGAGGDTSGAGGDGGGNSEPACVNPRTVTVDAQADTWIGSTKPMANHDSDKMLFVVGGSDEKRALIRLTLPVQQANSRLRRARLRFHLESNSDATKVLRRLAVHQLVQPLQEGRATWLNWGKNGETWTSPGGDYNDELARTAVPAGTSSGNVDFVVTTTVSQLLGQAAIPLSLIVLEVTQAPDAPAELAFTSTQGNASLIPVVLLDYCDP